MDKIRFCDLFSFVLAIAMGVVIYNFLTFRKEVKTNMVRMEASIIQTQSDYCNMEVEVDSLKSTSKIFAKSILYLDSCQVNKGQKAERAERRGRFLGGIIKGLFPGM